MKMPSSTPSMSALNELIWNGFSQPRSGWVEPEIGSAYTLTSATTANSASVTISAVSSQRCVLALSSMPMTQIHVITAIQTTPTSVTAQSVAAAVSQPKSRNV